jgi:hypothetical protein
VLAQKLFAQAEKIRVQTEKARAPIENPPLQSAVVTGEVAPAKGTTG